MTATRPSPAPATGYEPTRRPVGPIIVATAGLDAARALDAARRLASRTGAAVRVLSAVEPAAPPLPGIAGTPTWLPDLGVLAALQRERIVDQLRELGGDAAAWPVEVRIDSPPRAIADAARAHQASLIVMGIGRHDVVARLLGGEVALRTLRRAPVPVLAVADAPLPVPARTAVAAIDFSPSSVKAAHAALDLLGDATGRAQHLTRMIEGVLSIAVRADAGGRDVALSVGRGDGQTLLTFLPDAA